MKPDPDYWLTHVDAENLPNGTATILKVASPDRKEVHTATIDKHGYIRSLSRSRDYFPAGWEVVECE